MAPSKTNLQKKEKSLRFKVGRNTGKIFFGLRLASRKCFQLFPQETESFMR